MTIRDFAPRPMKLSVLTAAFQELTPRDRRDPDPDLAIEEWLQFARDIGSPNIQLSAALHPTLSDVPEEAMLDPVANTLDLRAPFDKNRAARVLKAMKATGVGLSDLGYFDNMLVDDPTARKHKHEFMLRVFDAAALLGANAVCGFVGRNIKLEMDENLVMFEEQFIPLLKEAKARGLTYRVEQCPMPGWNVLDRWHNNIAYAPGPWIALHRICEKHGVGDQFRIHYDPSHAILMGQDTRSLFQYLKDEGYGFLIGGFHVKGQVVDSRGVSAWGYGGQTMEPRRLDQWQAVDQPCGRGQCVEEAGGARRTRAPRHGTSRSPRLSAESQRRLARPPARRARAAVDQPGGHLSSRGARVSAGPHPGQIAARTDIERLARVREGHRRSRRRDVCASA